MGKKCIFQKEETVTWGKGLGWGDSPVLTFCDAWISHSGAQARADVSGKAEVSPALEKASSRKWKWVDEGPGAMLLFRGIIGCDSEFGAKL